ncbi:MAG: zinc-dependent metalloprotease [Chryseobacterium sp.]|jgi:hypothetical protein|uniref:zinc-dependent metalloprotease n=1 Tax=Chryseobacterium sp. TaxID=1871047 RepID=UPI002820F0F8|nr:zinc-dependent metalloprotease [Chryseobacterium sp.]MDR2236454.1 zinc-dependent metalloprotease [Chryseobacterium sp.]
MKKSFIILIGLLGFSFLGAQNIKRACATDKMMNEFFDRNPQIKAQDADLREYLRTDNGSQQRRGTVTIPVVVHVLYKTAQQNISDAQILSQIAVLNNDFRKQNADFSTVVPAAFQSSAADLELAFCMATRDPNGNPTTGIERKSVPSSFVLGNSYYTSAGLAAWDPTKYLNIWVGFFDGVDSDGEPWDDTLGFAYMPNAAGLSFDGLVIGCFNMGTVGTLFQGYDKGRTATHEIGHYFGLKHIWGNSGVCGTAAGSDDCADTPATRRPYYFEDNPVFPDNQYTCTTSANGAMFMNYMDYVADAQMAMFTNNQKTITSNTMSGPRASLLNSNACSFLAVNEVEKANSINLFPNPTTQYISIASPLATINEVEIFNAEGRLVKKAAIKNETDKIDVKDFANGVYYVRTYNGKEFVKSMKFIKK